MRYWLSILLFILIIPSLQAQERFSYRQCVEYALAHNLTLQNIRLDVEKQNITVENVRLNFLPRINAFSSYKIKSGKTLDDATNDYVEKQLFSNDWSVTGSMILFNGFRNANRTAFERYNGLAALEASKQEHNEIIYSILEAYVDYLLNTGLAKVQYQQCELSKKELERVEKMIELGRVAGTERYDIQARLANDEYLLLSYSNAAKRSETTLRKLMNYPLDSELEITDIETLKEVGLTLTDTAYPGNQEFLLPQIKFLDYRLKAAERNLKMEQGAFSPQLSLFSSWNSGYYQSVVDANGAVMKFPHQMNKNRSLNYGISVSFPLTDGLTWRNNVRIAKIEVTQAQNRLANEKNRMNYEVRQAQLDFNASAKEYHAAEKKAESEKAAFEMAKKRRENGLISIMEFYELRNNSARASIEVLRTRLQVYIMHTILKYYKTGSMMTW